MSYFFYSLFQMEQTKRTQLVQVYPASKGQSRN